MIDLRGIPLRDGEWRRAPASRWWYREVVGLCLLVPVIAGGTTAAFTQSHARFRNDDGSQTTATWIAAEDANTSAIQCDTNVRIRVQVDETAGGTSANFAGVLRYSHNGGAYTAVTASSTVVRASASANFADEAATTAQLTAPAGTFLAGAMDEADGSAGVNQVDFAAGQYTEFEYCVQIRSADVLAGDTIDFRVYRGTNALNVYTVTIRATVFPPLSRVVTAEALTLDDIGQGVVTRVSPGGLKLTDTVTAALVSGAADLDRAVTSDSLTVSDTVTARLTPLLVLAASDSLKISDALTASFGLARAVSDALRVSDVLVASRGLSASTTEALIVSDTVAVGGDALTAALSDSLTIVDVGQGVAQLLGVLHITDSITAALVGADLAADFTETVVVAEAMSRALTPLQVLGEEGLRIAESSTVARDASVHITAESGSVAEESVRARTNPDVVVLGDLLRISDSVSVALALSTSLVDALHLSESVTADENPRPVAVSAESLRVSDLVTTPGGLSVALYEWWHLTDETYPGESLRLRDAIVVALSAPLSATLSESLTLDDVGQGVAQLQGVLRISDTVTAALTGLDHLSVVVSVDTLKVSDSASRALDLVTTLTESVKVADTVTASGGLVAIAVEHVLVTDASVSARVDPLHMSVGAESLKASDTVTAAIGVGVLASESVAVDDGPVIGRLNPDAIALGESGRLQDSVAASVGAGVLVAAESLTIGDAAPLARLNPDHVAISEALRLQDAATASLDLSAALTDDVRLGEAVTADVTPRAILVTVEYLELSDAVIASRDLTVTVSDALVLLDGPVAARHDPNVVVLFEGVRLADAAPVVELTTDLGRTISDETLRVSETVSNARLNPAPVVVTSEAIRPTDGLVNASLNPTHLTLAPESLSVSDSLDALLSVLASSATEAVRISDAITVSITLEASRTESLRATDSVAGSADLVAALQEGVRLADSVQAESGLFVGATEDLRLQDAVSGQLTVLQVVVSEHVIITSGFDPLPWVGLPVPVTPDVVVIVRADVGAILVRADVGSILVRADVGVVLVRG